MQNLCIFCRKCINGIDLTYAVFFVNALLLKKKISESKPKLDAFFPILACFDKHLQMWLPLWCCGSDMYLVL